MRWVIVAALLLSSTPAAAEETAQQVFDAASAAADAGNCDEAVKRFATIEDGPSARKNPVVRAMIDLRKGRCLIGLERTEEGRSAVEAALPVLTAQGGSFAMDVREGHLALGKIASVALDYDRAINHYRAALALSRGVSRYAPLVSLGQLLAFDPGNEALDMMNEARTLVEADKGLDKQTLAGFQTMYARVLMNRGMYKEAYAELKDALKKQGGLRLKVSADDIVTRSDLAIAALLNDKPDDARNYLAYTGAGRLKDQPFERAVEMTVPSCGGSVGLKPDDYAVVEFSLLEDGSVSNAKPIFSTAGRAAALEFAQAVGEWAWKPEDAKAIPPLFRYLTRVELRCSNQSGARPSILQPLLDAFDTWAAERAPAIMPEQRLPALRSALERAKTDNDRPAMLVASVKLAASGLLQEPERVRIIDEAAGLAENTDVPIGVKAWITILRLRYDQHLPQKHREYRSRLRALLQDRVLMESAEVAAVIRLLLAERRYKYPVLPDATELLSLTANDPRLPTGHPLKLSAQLELANLLASKGNIDAARQIFSNTGLTEQQCALLDTQPAVRSGVATAKYPEEALRFEFEGWVQSEFDILADGTTIKQRVIMAYPPFVFTKAAEQISRNLRFETSFRPSSGTSCSANRHVVRFGIAN